MLLVLALFLQISNGQLDTRTVTNVVLHRTSLLRACYEPEVNRKPELRGNVVVRFVVDSSGSVSEAGIASTTLRDDAVEDCVTRVFRSMRFPPQHDGKRRIVFPLHFDQGQ